MAEKEMIQRNIEEFSRLQKYMILTEDKTSAAYMEMKDRYIELKIILISFGINLTELDKIKEEADGRGSYAPPISRRAAGSSPVRSAAAFPYPA